MPRMASIAPPAVQLGLTEHTDRRGMPYVKTSARITGPAHIGALAELCRRTGRSPATIAAELVTEELRYLAIPGARDQVRRARAERRRLFDPEGDRR
jgi:hypothetical protein